MTFSHEHMLQLPTLFTIYNHVHGRADLPTAQTLTTKDFKFKLNLPILAFLKHHPDQFVQMSLKHLKLAEH